MRRLVGAKTGPQHQPIPLRPPLSSSLNSRLLCLLVELVRRATRAILPPLDPLRVFASVFVGSVIATLTVGTLHYHSVSRHLIPHMSCAERRPPRFVYSMILVTTPAPTVRPPSRIAKRSPSSIAIGAINSINIFVLSPGITISTPSGISTLPVTSVVRK